MYKMNTTIDIIVCSMFLLMLNECQAEPFRFILKRAPESRIPTDLKINTKYSPIKSIFSSIPNVFGRRRIMFGTD